MPKLCQCCSQEEEWTTGDTLCMLLKLLVVGVVALVCFSWLP